MSKLKADLKTSQDSEASYKAKISALEGDLSAAKAKADAAAKLEADLKACQDGSASLNAKISSLESDLSGANAKLAAATAAAAAGGAAAGATVASTASGASADSGPSFDDDYDAIKARLDELEHLATDDEEDTDEELQGWEKETIALQGRITTLRGRAPNDAARAGADGLDATAVSLLEILRKARADKTAGVAKLKRPAYGHGQRDDLKEILGVGPVLEKMLNGLGVYTFREIALWDKARIEEVSSHMGSFQDRIEREDWVSQCKELHRAKYGESV
jgi:predicted flap endonuclease-1-like 5' DNA nuclease